MSIYIQEFWVDDLIRIPVVPTRNQRVEIPFETIFSREIVDIYRDHWINLLNIGVTRKYNMPARQGIKSQQN